MHVVPLPLYLVAANSFCMFVKTSQCRETLAHYFLGSPVLTPSTNIASTDVAMDVDGPPQACRASLRKGAGRVLRQQRRGKKGSRTTAATGTHQCD
jgi:hypothetical protein